MKVKDSFKLVSNVPNVINLSESILRSFYDEENSPRHVFAILELKKSSIKHFTNKKIFGLISNIKKRDTIQAVTFDYPLPVSFNPPTKGLIINLKSFETKQIANMNPNDLYASLVYAYSFDKLIHKKFKISESYTKIIVNYLLSLYVKAFGRDYGLVGIYSSGIPKLKFLLTCYILASYFGYPTNKKLFMKASSIAPYMYANEADQLRRYDFSDITQFIKANSDLKVMPGLSVAKFTSKLYRYYDVNVLAALEDCSRFFSVIVTSSVPGSRVVPRHLVKANEKEYFNLVEITRGIF
jgi:hypothetical protein